ncbi:uncharacterized protein LOC113356713 [Papaver somniferum]|uniref:uncharacterized protein LOC113356713 n=1 Tax=Papaver somniferum TaxID=3469 RepID=UPI000E6FE379|nr:uncharacterized protein LOC113356713 [Papaver somniferum]
MCRVTENQGFYQSERDRLKIKAFYLRLSVSKVKKNQLPESLTLLYLPRINESPLEINDTKIRSDASGFITLYRMRSEEEKKKRIMMMKAEEEIEEEQEVIYASREKVRVSEGVRFEVYSREDKILKGIYRKDIYDDWKLESKCVLENDPSGFKISEAEIFVSGDGNVSINEKIEIVIKRRRKNNSKRRFFKVLEEIPEDREEGEEKEENESDSSCCCCGGDDEMIGSDLDDERDFVEKSGSDDERTWAVDVGIWVMCLGVGYLVSKSSSRTLRRRRMMFR